MEARVLWGWLCPHTRASRAESHPPPIPTAILPWKAQPEEEERDDVSEDCRRWFLQPCSQVFRGPHPRGPRAQAHLSRRTFLVWAVSSRSLFFREPPYIFNQIAESEPQPQDRGTKSTCHRAVREHRRSDSPEMDGNRLPFKSEGSTCLFLAMFGLPSACRG